MPRGIWTEKMLFFNVCAKFGRNYYFLLQNKSTETEQRPGCGRSYPCWPWSAPRRAQAGRKCPFPSRGLTCFPTWGLCLWPPHHGQAGGPRRESTTSKDCCPELSMVVATGLWEGTLLQPRATTWGGNGAPSPWGAPTSVPQTEWSRKDHPHVSSSPMGLRTGKPTGRTHLGSRGVGTGGWS